MSKHSIPIEVVRDGEVIAVYSSRVETAKAFGTSLSTVARVCRGELPFWKNPSISFRYQERQMDEPEDWKPVANFERWYEVSSLGRMRNIRTRRLLETAGTVLLKRAGLAIETNIFRLVAEAFVPGRTPEKNHVIHLDKNKKNNRASNLRWATNSNPGKEVEVWKDGALVATFPSTCAAAKMYRCSKSGIEYTCKGTGYMPMKHPGLFFRYAEEEN